MGYDGPMYALRCTERLRKRVAVPFAAEPIPSSTTILGDWFVGLQSFGRRQLVLAISARTLLPVLLPARNVRDLPTTLPDAVARVLLRLGVPDAAVASECAEMTEAVVSKTNDRRILGSMNDFARMLDGWLRPGRDDLVDAALDLARAPCGPIAMDSPNRLTLRLFENARPSV